MDNFITLRIYLSVYRSIDPTFYLSIYLHINIGGWEAWDHSERVQHQDRRPQPHRPGHEQPEAEAPDGVPGGKGCTIFLARPSWRPKWKYVNRSVQQFINHSTSRPTRSWTRWGLPSSTPAWTRTSSLPSWTSWDGPRTTRLDRKLIC